MPPTPTPLRRPVTRAAVPLAIAAVTVSLLVAPTASAAPARTAPATNPVAALAPAAVSSAAAEARVARLLPSRLRNRALGSLVGLHVADAGTGRAIYGSRSTQPLMPASTMKIVTATTALMTLGPNARFVTRTVVGSGPQNLVLVGGGDPRLSSADLRRLATRTARAWRATAATGAVRVTLDDTLFPAPSAAPGWGSTYQPGVVSPVRSLNRDGRHTWDNADDAARYFVARLNRAGLKATYRGRAAADPGATALASVRSQQLKVDIRWMLKMSDNDVAEILFRQVALATGQPATWAGASRAAVTVLESLGIATDGLVLVDGSGASRRARLTPYALTEVLRLSVTGEHPELDPIYADGGLPVAGVDGTLTTRLGRYNTAPSRCAAGRVMAKTGTLTGVISLAGVAQGADGRPKVFAVLVNRQPSSVAKLTTRRAVDGLAATVTGCW
ncbi:MAG: D-alanyl-D-alanine carboxypeptidase/D-alanyl-D-alanine-endopeptidase [Candidatus Nanopelagicales bacterium]